jgi:hypothetical protein
MQPSRSAGARRRLIDAHVVSPSSDFMSDRRDFYCTMQTMSDILLAAKLAGILTADAVWCVSEGDILIPIYSYATHDGARRFERIVADKLEDAAAFGKARLDENPHNALAAVLILDGYINFETGKTDALIVDIRIYSDNNAAIVIVLPFRAASSVEGFAVHRPKLRELHSVGEDQIPAIVEAFLSGVDSHEQGTKIWNEHLDESR